MKKICRIAGQFVIMALTVLMIQSCSKGAPGLDAKLAAVASDDVDLVLMGNFQRFFDQTDIKVDGGEIKLPEYIQATINTMMGRRDKEDLNVLLKDVKGIDYNNILLVTHFDLQNPRGVFVFSVSDAKALAKSIQNLNDNVSTENLSGYMLIGNRHMQFLIKDELAYIVFDKGGPMSGIAAIDNLKQWNHEAEANPLASWKKDFVSQDKVINGLMAMDWFFEVMKMQSRGASMLTLTGVDEAIVNGYVGMSANLDGPNVRLEFESLDKDGKGISNPYQGDFDTDLMKYASANDILAASIAINHQGYEKQAEIVREVFKNSMPYMYRSFMNEMQGVVEGITGFAKTYLSDGGIFFAGGIAEGKSILAFNPDSPDSFHIVLAAALNPERKDEAYGMICVLFSGLMGDNVTATVSEEKGMKTTAFKMRQVVDYDFRNDRDIYEELIFYVALDGNNIVISNKPVEKSGSSVFNKSLFKGSAGAMQFVLSEKTSIPFAFGLPFGVDATLYAKESRAELEVSLTGTDKHFLEALLGFLTGLR